MKKLFILLIGVAMFSSCADKAPIPPKDMNELVYELFLTDKFIESIPDLRMQADTTNVYKPVIERHGYTVEQFYDALYYYIREPEDFCRMMKDIQRRMTEERDRLYPSEEDENAEIIEGREKEDVMEVPDEDADRKIKDRKTLRESAPEAVGTPKEAEPEPVETNKDSKVGRKKRLTKEQIKAIEERMK